MSGLLGVLDYVVWYGTVWFGMVCNGMVWYGTANYVLKGVGFGISMLLLFYNPMEGSGG